MTPEERQAIHDAVMEAAEIRGVGRDNSDREGLAWRVVAILERTGEQGEMGNWSGEDPVRNAGHKADMQRKAHRDRLDEANAAAAGSKVTLDELRKRRRS